jgi:hypothetical protein
VPSQWRAQRIIKASQPSNTPTKPSTPQATRCESVNPHGPRTPRPIRARRQAAPAPATAPATATATARRARPRRTSRPAAGRAAAPTAQPRAHTTRHTQQTAPGLHPGAAAQAATRRARKTSRSVTGYRARHARLDALHPLLGSLGGQAACLARLGIALGRRPALLAAAVAPGRRGRGHVPIAHHLRRGHTRGVLSALLLRLPVQIMGSSKCRNVGQPRRSLLIMNDPMISARTRIHGGPTDARTPA